MNWKDITIDKIQRIEAVDETNEVLKTARIISILKDIPFEQVLAMSLNEFRAIDLTFLNEMPKSKLTFKFKHNGRRFRLIKSAREMSAHHFIELQELASKDKIQALHEIIGCLSYRVNIFGRKIEDDYTWKVDNFKSLPVTNFYNYALFFSALYPKLLDATLTYLKEEIVKAKEMSSDGSASSTD
jgi:hypothetical protein